jgi:hypothetical protein
MDHLSTEAILEINKTANLAHSPLADRPMESSSLAKCVHRAILRLAPGRIRELRVDEREGQLILSGRCASFYCKQVAQHAAMDLANGDRQIQNRIAVD